MKRANKLLAIILSVVLLIGTMPVFANAASAYDFADFPRGTWSEEAMTAAVNNGLLKGKTPDRIYPEDYLTRAEAAAIINRAFGATVKADVSAFADVAPGAWYYEDIQKAVNMGTFMGTGNNTFAPEGYITRESMFTVLARALVLFDSNASSLSGFVDNAAVSGWARGHVSAMTARNYVNGNGNGYLNPQDYITRQEFAQVMHNIFKVYVSNSGDIKNVTYGTTIIRVPNVNLENVTILGDLILGDGVGTGDVTLKNVKVTGRILCRGGEGKVHFVSGCSVGENIVVHDVNGVVNFNNYRNEAIFTGINLDTQATFLGSITINPGSSSVTPPSSQDSQKTKYKVEIYKQKIQGVDDEKEYILDDTLTKSAKKGANVTYTPDEITGFVVDADKSVLSGTNKNSLVLSVYYNRKEVKVTFDGNDYRYLYGQLIEDVKELDDKLAEALQDAIDANPGYDVTLQDQNGNKVDSNTEVTKDITVSIAKTPITYTIEYDLDGGSVQETLKTSYTVLDSYTLPTPKKSGNVFLGWFDQNGTEVVTVGGAVIGNLTLTAKWRPYENAKIYFEHIFNGDKIEVSIKIDRIPENLEDLSAISLEFGYDKSMLTLADATNVVPGVFHYSDYGISWYSEDPLTQTELEDADYTLFTLVFNKVPTAEGKTQIEFVKITKLADSKYQSSTLYETEDLEITLSKTIYKITFGGEVFDIVAGNPISSNLDLVNAMRAVDKADHETHYYVGLTEIDFDYIPEKSEEITYDYEYVGPTTRYYTVTFNGTDYDVEQGKAISSNVALVNAMNKYVQDEEAAGFTVEFYVGSTKIDTTYEPAGNVEITVQKTPIIKYYTVKFNGTDYDVEQGKAISSNAALVSAMNKYVQDEAALGFTVEFYVGSTKIDITYEPAGNVEITVQKTPIIKYYTVKFNGTDYDVVQGKAISTNADLVTAMVKYAQDAEADGYTVKFYVGTTEIDTSYVPTGDVEITTQKTPITVYYTVTFNGEEYKVEQGAELSSNIALVTAMNKYIQDAEADGYTVKFYVGTTEINTSYVPANDVEITTQKTEIIKYYTVTFNGTEYGVVQGKAISTNADLVSAMNKYVQDEEAAGFAIEFYVGTTMIDTSYIPASNVEITVLKTPIITYHTVKFNGEEYKVVQGSELSTNTELVTAMVKYAQDAEADGYTVKFYVGTTEITTSYVPQSDVEITAQKTPITVYYTVTFNGEEYKVEQGAELSSNIALVTAMNKYIQDAEAAGYTVKFYVDTTEIDTSYVPGADVTITTEKTEIITNHLVRLYLGVVNDYNYMGEYLVPNGEKLTQAQIDAVIDPADIVNEVGYTDSDGNVHEIAPEFWYNNGSEWVLFDVSMPITKPIDICLLTRYITFTYDTTLSVKGIEIPQTTIAVPYNDDTNIGETILDALASARKTIGRNLDFVKNQGYDVYQMAIDKAASKGIVDTDGNILNPEVPIPLNRIITEEFISKEIDAYIDDNIHDDEFIADLISNDHVEQVLLKSEGLRIDLLTNTNSKNLIKEKILENKEDPTLKEDIKKALKSIVKDDKAALLEDAEILNTFTNKVDEYLNNNAITYVTAADVVDFYKNDTLDAEHSELYEDIIAEFEAVFELKYGGYFDTNYTQLMNDHFDEYYDDTVDTYVNHTIDDDLKKYIDEKLTWYETKLIADFISGEDRTLLHEAIPHYAHTAVEAIKQTEAYRGPISDFVSGNGVRVNEENLVFIEILSGLMHSYDYEKLSSHFLPAKAKEAIDKLGKDVAEKYVDKYLEVFTDGMDTAIDNLNTDLNADIYDTEYKFSTKPAVRINYVEDFVVNYYNKLMPKLREKLYSQTKLDLESNLYAKRLVDMDILSKYLDEGKAADEVYSGYALKDDVLEYYDVTLEIAVLMHDAIVWYEDEPIKDKLDVLSNLIGTYANKANNMIMHFINTGELPKGFTLEGILDKSDRVESIYDRFEDKIEKAYDLYENYLDRNYSDIIDLANLSVYADGVQYKLYQIVIEEGNEAFDVDNLITAIFDDANYHGVSKLENAMTKIRNKLEAYKYTPEESEFLYVVDAYKATLDSREIKGFSTGDHTVEIQRTLRYID